MAENETELTGDQLDLRKRAADFLLKSNGVGCNTLDEIKERMVFYVDYCNEVQAGMPSITTMNRRYGIQAAKMGSTAKQLIAELVADGKLELLSYKRGMALISGKQSEKWTAMDWKLNKTTKYSSDMKATLLKNVF